MKPDAEVIVLGMFDLSRLDRAMPVRISNLYQALNAMTPTRLIAGNRLNRRRSIIQHLKSGILSRSRAIYVESSTSTATEMDILLMALARTAHIPLLVFIPDAYQLFPEIFPRRGWRVRLLDLGWNLSIWFYRQLASSLLFPSQGLADIFHPKTPYRLLPPAGLPGRLRRPLSWDPPQIVYMGAASYRYGSDILLDSMPEVIAHYPDARCRFVTVDDSYISTHPQRSARWLDVENKVFDELEGVFDSATLAVAPLRRNAYNDLAMPVKTFDFMSFGRPLVVTDCPTMASLVEETEAGLVVQDNPQALSDGMLKLLRDPGHSTRLGQNAYNAIQTTHSWPKRAVALMEMIQELENHPGGNN